MDTRRAAAKAKGRIVQGAATRIAAALRRHTPSAYEPGTTIVTVNWNSLQFLQALIATVTASSSAGTRILVIDNASTDGSREYLARRPDISVVNLPINVGHGQALDLVVPRVKTEFLAVLDIDAFPISPRWLDVPLEALSSGAKVAGAHTWRNFVHPCYLVTMTETVHRYGLTFRPVGALDKREDAAPLFMDVAEALSHRALVKFGGSRTLHFIEPTFEEGGGVSFGGLVYHNMWSARQPGGRVRFQEALDRYHPGIQIT